MPACRSRWSWFPCHLSNLPDPRTVLYHVYFQFTSSHSRGAEAIYVIFVYETGMPCDEPLFWKILCCTKGGERTWSGWFEVLSVPPFPHYGTVRLFGTTPTKIEVFSAKVSAIGHILLSSFNLPKRRCPFALLERRRSQTSEPFSSSVYSPPSRSNLTDTPYFSPPTVLLHLRFFVSCY
jgi:hypothetical protein